ncbi:hypothetical protein LJC68_10000 [Bacteroidales bacterium OttesenSCG-928-B11]|nr:hypothetical protein [Bacteroidales bacterium OttesenSCG-928-E04]MDL2308870.1 hypothetical protein [Bacteroidales bacterium OttesenSCG-928-C03]MDL2313192.1 hypothetical protein [Bacteroidales bacterium OttesenSCG-928-B11]MDL2326913.1 hypothetical protein [Bacteroidales bacterium OttesenSCG-928-A14]
MTNELKEAIENLYKTFAVYPSKSTMEGCPCCVSTSDKEKIHSKQLRNLNEDDISRYAFKAMTTWGDTNDFKHYLPRIFELLATTDFIVDTFVVLGKLGYGEWQTWKDAEKNAIIHFLWNWWTDTLKHKSYFDKEIFIEIYKLTGDIEQLLTRWALSFEDNSFSNFVDLVHDYYADLMGKRTEFKELDNASIGKLIKWINNNSEILEKGYFHFADKDNLFAEKISDTQYIYERT